MKENNTVSAVIITILVMLLLGLGGFVLYDKVIKNDNVKSNSTSSNTKTNTTENVSNENSNMSEEEKLEDYQNNPEKYFTKEDAQEALRDYFNNEEGINFKYMDTVTVNEEGKTEYYYKFDVRKHNGAGTNSRLDIFYIIVDKHGGGIYDSETFKDKFGVE